MKSLVKWRSIIQIWLTICVSKTINIKQLTGYEKNALIKVKFNVVNRHHPA